MTLSGDSSLYLNTLGQDSQGPLVSKDVLAFDGNVTLGLERAYILGQGDEFGELFLAQGPWGSAPPARQPIDANAVSFQTINAN